MDTPTLWVGEDVIYLEETLKSNQIPITHIKKDEDWDNYKEDKDFKELLNKYRDIV